MVELYDSDCPGAKRHKFASLQLFTIVDLGESLIVDSSTETFTYQSVYTVIEELFGLEYTKSWRFWSDVQIQTWSFFAHASRVYLAVK